MNGITYTSSEQFIQSQKANLFNDDTTESRILASTSPYEAKKLGSTVHGFSEVIWKEQCKEIARRGIYAKFSQNQVLADRLISTEKKIHEASVDRLWGTGIRLKSGQALDTQSWYGDGLMADVLQNVREMLKDDRSKE